MILSLDWRGVVKIPDFGVSSKPKIASIIGGASTIQFTDNAGMMEAV